MSSLLQDDKKSRYNSRVFMGKCELCNKPSTETHHIEEQQTANEEGYLEKGYHKNKEFNLIVLCESCHLKIHKKEVKIGTRKQSTKGIKMEK
jgi:5-methylcytosine-specific restriction endonuclease McrA